MGRFIRIVGKDHREPQEQALGPEAREKAWREALRIKTAGREASELSICLQHRRMADACVEEFCAWFEKQVGILTRRGITAHIDTIDLSNNEIADRGVACIASTLGKLSPKSFRVLKLHHNRIKDVCAPLLQIIAWGKLAELHLSHNELSPKSIYEIVVAAASAKDGAGSHRYPRSGTSPLWLRIEGNRQNAAASEKLAVDITEALCSIRRPLWRSICVVDGTTQCGPSRCCAKVNAPPAMHLTYMDFGQEKRFDPKRWPPTPRGKHDDFRNRCATGHSAARVAPEARGESCTSRALDIFHPDAFPPLERAAKEVPRGGKIRRWPKPLEVERQRTADSVEQPAACLDTAQTTGRVPAHEAICNIAAADYEAEAGGYLSATFGDPIYVHSDEQPADVGCRYASYIFGQNGRTHEFGWFPNMTSQEHI